MIDDLISRRALLKNRFSMYMGFCGTVAVVAVKDVENAPAVDAVEVVRCGECIHRGKDSWCAYVDDDPDFFCKRGRRVTNAADNV